MDQVTFPACRALRFRAAVAFALSRTISAACGRHHFAAGEVL
jgi:hypothetical protein